MANARSRNYPYADLPTALSLARKAYDKDKRNKMSRLALAKHVGNDSLSGPALSKLGLLRAYGLIDGSGDDLRITDDAETALEAPEGSAERANALRRLALTPTLFQEIRKEFPTVPSEDNLRFWLVKRQIAGHAATKAAKAYLNTLRLVGQLEADYTLPSDVNEEQEMESSTSGGQTPAKPKFQIDQTTIAAPPVGVRREVFTLDEGDVVLSFPENLSPASYKDLKDYFDLFLRKAKRQSEKQAGGADDGEAEK